MEWTVVGVIVVLVTLVLTIAKPMSELAASLAENTQSMKDLRGEFEKWDKRNDDGHASLKSEIGKNRDEVNGVLKEHQKKIETNRHDIENHEARLQVIEKNK